uniref:Uncharacterized protein n=1 Tax=Anguilla anguilla TaxID=7936 RepID=A0A0E9WPH2_ANGAN
MQGDTLASLYERKYWVNRTGSGPVCSTHSCHTAVQTTLPIITLSKHLCSW